MASARRLGLARLPALNALHCHHNAHHRIKRSGISAPSEPTAPGHASAHPLRAIRARAVWPSGSVLCRAVLHAQDAPGGNSFIHHPFCAYLLLPTPSTRAAPPSASVPRQPHWLAP